MPRYLQTAADLKKEVDSFIATHVRQGDLSSYENAVQAAAVQLGHIINLAVRCNPRQAQGTVRKNIVATAMANFCHVTMTKEHDEKTDRSYNKIHITAK